MRVTYKKGICSGCEDEKLIVHKSKKLCLYCLRKSKIVKASSFKKSSIKQKFRKPTGELELFKQIWEERPHVSQISNEPLESFNIFYFSHILTKQSYPGYRLKKENIWIVTPSEHREWETGSREDSKWDKKKEMAEKLKAQYNREHKVKKFTLPI